MNKGQSTAWGKTLIVLSALFLSQVYLSSAFARSTGVITTTGFNTDGSPVQACSDCHGFDATTVMILGPQEVLAHETNTYSLQISSPGPGVVGGLDVAAPDGILGLIDAVNEGTQLVNDTATGLDEVTHNGVAKAFTSGTVSWLFTWQAPDTPGSYDIFGQGVNANNAQGNNNDFTGMTTLTVQVAAIPIPAAAILFGSALGVLGWLRRRVA